MTDEKYVVQKEGDIADIADSPPGRISRRKFVTMLGAAGAALAAGSVHGSATAEASLNDNCVAMTVAELRQLTSPSANYVYYVMDPGREGIFKYDATDTTSVDNGGTVIRTGTGATGKCYKRVMNDGVVNVRWFGAVGDGVTNDAPAIQAAIAGMKQGQTLLIPYATMTVPVLDSNGNPTGTTVVADRGTYNIASPITLSASHITITGGGKLKNDTANSTLVLVWVTNIIIDDIRFENPVATVGGSAIELQNALYVEIRNCRFSNIDKAIYASQITNFSDIHQVRRIKIHGNRFEGVNYALYGVFDPSKNSLGKEFLMADIQFENNQSYCLYTHIHAAGLDGLICTGNPMFFPGYTSDPTKQNKTKINNIYIEHSNWVVIQNNNLFEAGIDAIVLSKFENANISNNNIGWPGQVTPGSGIKLTGGGLSNKLCLSTVSGNNITFPTLHGIWVQGNCGHIAITGNQIRYAGYSEKYYGTASLGDDHYGIFTDATTEYINISGNLSSQNYFQFFGDKVFFADNLDVNGGYSSKTRDFLDVATHPSTALRFTNGWNNLGSGNATCQYYKDNYNVIHLKGVIYGGAVGTSIFTLQQYYYSTTEKFIFTVPTQNGFGTVEVQKDGKVVFTAGDPTGYVSLCGISFRI